MNKGVDSTPIGEYPQLSKKVYEIICSHGDRIWDKDNLTEELLKKYPELYDSGNYLSRIVLKILNDYQTQGVVSRKKFSLEMQTEVYLTEQQRTWIQDLLSILDRVKSLDSDTLQLGLARAQSIMANPNEVAKLMEKAKENSPSVKTLDSRETCDLVYSIVSSQPNLLPANITDILEQQYSIRLTEQTIWRHLSKLRREGRLTMHKKKNNSYWSLPGNNTVDKEPEQVRYRYEEREFPEDPEERLKVVLSTVNHGFKASCLLLYDPGKEIEFGELDKTFNSLIAGTPMSRRHGYRTKNFSKSFFNGGFVKEVHRKNQGGYESLTAYLLTQAGEKFGRSTAAFVMYAEKKLGYSLCEVFGSAPKGLQVSGPYVRGKILEVLEAMEGNSASANKLIQTLPSNPDAVYYYLNDLTKNGFLRYDKDKKIYITTEKANHFVESFLLPLKGYLEGNSEMKNFIEDNVFPVVTANLSEYVLNSSALYEPFSFHKGDTSV